MSSGDAVEYEPAGTHLPHVGEIVLNRPDERNTMSPALLRAFSRASAAARGDREARCLLIRSSGAIFCAGANLRGDLQSPDHDAPSRRSLAMYEPFLSLLQIEIPIVGALMGHAVGGGFGLALLCDLRVADRDAKYGANFARLGIGAGMAISALLPRLIGLPRASELLYTGALISGARMAELGLANSAHPAEEVLPEARKLAQAISLGAPMALRAIKQSIHQSLAWDLIGAAKLEAALQAETLSTHDAQEGVAALLEKRTPRFEGR